MYSTFEVCGSTVSSAKVHGEELKIDLKRLKLQEHFQLIEQIIKLIFIPHMLHEFCFQHVGLLFVLSAASSVNSKPSSR